MSRRLRCTHRMGVCGKDHVGGGLRQGEPLEMQCGCEVHCAEEAFVDWSKVMGVDEVQAC